MSKAIHFLKLLCRAMFMKKNRHTDRNLQRFPDADGTNWRVQGQAIPIRIESKRSFPEEKRIGK